MWGVFPRWMGITICVAGPALIVNSLCYLIIPGYDGDMNLLFNAPLILAEFWLAGWMLVNVPHPAKNREFFPAAPGDKA